MKIGAIVQGRMSSNRLPGKVLLPLAGKPVLWHVLNRLKFCKTLDVIVLATSVSKEDRKLKKVADSLDIPTFFGSLDDVLSRYYLSAKKYKLDTVVRITADCPVIDPHIVDEVVRRFIKGGYDLYGISGNFPDGLDTSVLSFKAIEDAYKKTKLPSDREHVGTTFFRTHKDMFKTGGYEKFKDKGNYRWTLDEPEDYEFLKKVYEALYQEGELFFYQDIFKLLEKKPELMKINSFIGRNEGYAKSLKEDKKFLRKRKI